MNSHSVSEALSIAPQTRAPRSILALTIAYDALLLAAGVALLFKEYDRDWFSALTVAFLPALIYSVAVFRYGGALFAPSQPAQGLQAWWRLVLLSSCLFGVTLIAFISPEFPDMRNETHYGIPGQTWWTVATLAILCLLALWAWIIRRLFLRPGRAVSDPNKLNLASLAGGVLILASLALDVNYDSAGWQVFTWHGGWATTYFIQIDATELPLQALCLAGYAAGLLLALLSIWAAVRALADMPPGAVIVERLRNLAVIVFWFTVTNYLCTLLLEVTIGIFNFQARRPQFVLIMVAWLAMLAAGLALWFRFRLRLDARGGKVRTALLLWTLPLAPLIIVRFLDAVAWDLFGLMLFVAGVLVLAACWWKLAETQRATADPKSRAASA